MIRNPIGLAGAAMMAFLGGGVVPTVGATQGEGVAFGVDHYAAYFACSGDTLSYAASTAYQFKLGLAEIDFAQTNHYANSAVDGRDFIDALSDHVDPYGIDHADVAFYAGHGSHKCDSSAGDYYSSSQWGTPTKLAIRQPTPGRMP